MGVNVRGGRGTGINRGNGGGGGISKVDSSITWDKMPPTTDPTASRNRESARPVVLAAGCETTTLNASSFKWYVAGTSKTQIETGSVVVVSPVVIVVAAAYFSPPPP